MCKRKAAEEPVQPTPARGGRGRGGSRGGGRPAAQRGLGADRGPNVQTSLAELLGSRAKPAGQAASPPAAAGGSGDALEPRDDDITWEFLRHHGDDKETKVPCRQRPGGPVVYEMEKDKPAVVLAKGERDQKETYYVSAEDSDEEVDADEEGARERERDVGGKLKIRLRDARPIWVTNGHVRLPHKPAGEPATAPAAAPAALGKRAANAGGETTTATADGEVGDDGDARGGGIKAVAAATKKAR